MDYSVAKELGDVLYVQDSFIVNATLKQRKGQMSIELGGASSLEPGAGYRVIETQLIEFGLAAGSDLECSSIRGGFLYMQVNNEAKGESFGGVLRRNHK